MTVVLPSAAFAAVKQFGTTTPGTYWGCPAADYKYGNKYTLSERGSVTKITAYMKGNGGTGTQKFKTMIYAADGTAGGPGTLLATSQEVTVAGNAAPGMVDFPINPKVSLNAGDYWIAQLSGPDGGQACLSGTGGGPNSFNVNPYGSGPSNPFNASAAISTSPETWTLAATYETDTTAPTITVPAPITVEASSAAGAQVTYSVSATDPDDAASAPVCVPASGSTFPLGTTTVNCSSHDTNGNNASASFTITVRAGFPTDKTQCKNDGWKRFTHPSFKNQGECVSLVEHGIGHEGDDRHDSGNNTSHNDERDSDKQDNGHGHGERG
jgi:hypothetical protein